MNKEKDCDPVPENPEEYTSTMDKYYNRLSTLYDFLITIIPVWKRWIKSVLPWIKGPDVLLAEYAGKYTCSAIDFNKKIVNITRKKLSTKKLKADVVQGDVNNLPYDDRKFDSIINTMAFTGYPDGNRALQEMKCVLKDNGILLLVDFDYPENNNKAGRSLVKMMQNSGDLIKSCLIKMALITLRKLWADSAASGCTEL